MNRNDVLTALNCCKQGVNYADAECGICGKELPDKADYCPCCGRKVLRDDQSNKPKATEPSH